MGDAKTRRRGTDAPTTDEGGSDDSAPGARGGAAGHEMGGRGRRGGMRSRGRESGVIGLVERARLTPSLLGMGPLLDPLLSSMP
ncbi:MAG: hypothetical protein ACHQ1E_12420, partial [Ktedonobacterales bacterium]